MTIGAIVFIALAQVSDRTQANIASPKFEVASIKKSAVSPGGQTRGGGKRATGPRKLVDGGRVTYLGTTLQELVVRAYGVEKEQVVGPDWLDGQQYDISAKIPDGASQEQVPVMLQNLLAERFRMSTHWETKQQRVYGLLVDKGGPHLKASKEPEGAESVSFGPQGRTELKGYKLENLAEFLAKFLDAPVVDKTGISGRFDITVVVDMASLKSGLAAANSPAGSDADVSIFGSVKELGLKLVSQTGQVRRLIVDKADRDPSTN